jgi:hypothetical protein
VKLFKGKKPETKKEEFPFPAIRIMGRDGSVLFEGALNTLCFTEKLVIEKSIFFFNDEEPCFIHRSAVAARLFGELCLLLEKQPRITLAELDETCVGYLDVYKGADYIEVISTMPVKGTI